jgi:hypothetical protein
MSSRRKTNQTVLFLGAGASAAFGLPITSAIFPHIREGLLANTLFPLESNPKRERAKMNRLRDYLSRLMPAVFEEDVEVPLITDVLSLIDLLINTGEIGIPMVSTNDMEDFRTLLLQAIVETIEKGWSNLRLNPHMHRLTDWILNQPESAPLTIVSTNYDTLIESLLFEKIETSLMDAETNLGEFVDLGFSWREHTQGRFLEAVNHPPKTPLFRLFKLHGSLSWLKCPLCGFIYVNKVGSIFQQAFREDKIDYNNTCVCGHGPVRAVIVAPSMVRSIQDADLLTIWRSALEALRTSDEWIIGGYSLPPEDIAIRSILLRAYLGRKGKPPKIRVVQRDKDTKLEGRYRLLFPNCSFEYGGFEAFIESLPKTGKHWPTF